MMVGLSVCFSKWGVPRGNICQDCDVKNTSIGSVWQAVVSLCEIFYFHFLLMLTCLQLSIWRHQSNIFKIWKSVISNWLKDSKTVPYYVPCYKSRRLNSSETLRLLKTEQYISDSKVSENVFDVQNIFSRFCLVVKYW